MKVKKLIPVVLMTLLLLALLGVNAAYAATPGTITLLAPNNGETFYTNLSYDIKWTYYGQPGQNLGNAVKIDLYQNNVFRSNITPSTSLVAGSYLWTVPSTLAGGGYRIVVTDAVYSEVWSQSRYYHTINKNDAEVVSENIPEYMENGKKYNVAITLRNTGSTTWGVDWGHVLSWGCTTDPFAAGSKAFAAGERIYPGGTKTFNFTMTAPAQTGTYAAKWTMAQTGIQVFGASISKSIKVQPSWVTVASPNGGQLLNTGRSYSLQWSHIGTPGVNLGSGVKLELFKGGVFNSTISSNVSYGSNGNTYYYWIPPATLSGSDFQIKITDLSDGNISDLSDNYFTIATDNAAYVSDTIPTVMETNKKYEVSVTFRNTGTSTWTSVDRYLLGASTLSDPFASATQGLGTDIIAPGQTKTFNFTMTAPVYAGVYQTSWVMMHQGVSFGFGDVLTKSVTVNYPPTGLNIPPEVTSADPVNKATSVPLDKVITITFSEDIKPGIDFANISLQTVHDVPVPAIFSIVGNKLIATPSSPLSANTAYYVNITANAVYDLTDMEMKAPYQLYFDTLAPGAPRIVVTNPADGTKVNGIVSGITATFVDDVGTVVLSIDGVQVAQQSFPLYAPKREKDHMTFIYNWDTTGLADGSQHTITVTTFGYTGSTGTSKVTIDKSIVS